MYIKYIAGSLLSIKKGYNFKCVIFIQNPLPHLQQEWTGLRISLKAGPPLSKNASMLTLKLHEIILPSY